MYVALIAAFVALIIAAATNEKRKGLLKKPKQVVVANNSNHHNNTQTPPSTPATPVQQPKNSGMLNAVLYIGCALIIASMIGFASYADSSLVSPMLLGVTIILFVASIVLRLKVPFLKSCALAFNVTSIILIPTWLSFFTYDTMAYGRLMVSLIACIFAIISAVVFESKAYWHVSAILLLATIFGIASLVFKITVENNNPNPFGTYSQASVSLPFCSIASIIPITLTIVFRYFWRGRVKFVPIKSRSAVLAASYYYLIAGALFAFFALTIESAVFVGSISAFLICVFTYIDYALADKSFLPVRLAAQALALAFCFDFLCAVDASYETSMIFLLSTAFLTSFIQIAISIYRLIKKHSEEAHRSERFALAFSSIILAITSAIASSMHLGTGKVNEALSAIITIGPLLSMIVLVVAFALTIFFDRNSRYIILAPMFAVSFFSILTDSEIVGAVISAILGLCAAFSYFSLKELDKEESMQSCITAAITLCFFSFCYSVMLGSLYWVPILLAGIIVALFGHFKNNLNTKDAGFIIGSFAIGLAAINLASSNLITDNAIGDLISLLGWIQFPIMFLVRDALRKPSIRERKDVHNARFVSGYLIGELIVWYSAEYYLRVLDEPMGILGFALIIIVEIAALVYAIYAKSKAFIIICALALMAIALNTSSYSAWILLFLFGIGLISFAVYAIYKTSTKNQAGLQPTQPTPAPVAAPETKEETTETKDSKEKSSKEESSEEKSSTNTEIQFEKVEDQDKKTLA